MAKRVVYECDFTKQEYDPEDTVSITIKYKNKTGRKYEISGDAAKLIEGQLTAGLPLPEGWSFDTVLQATVEETAPGPVVDDYSEVESAASRRERLAQEADDAENRDGDDELARRIKSEHKDRLEDEDEEVPEEDEGPTDPDACAHMNRSRVQMTEKSAHVTCKDCGVKIPLKKSTERDVVATTKAPAGSRKGYHESKRKKR